MVAQEVKPYKKREERKHIPKVSIEESTERTSDKDIAAHDIHLDEDEDMANEETNNAVKFHSVVPMKMKSASPK